MIEIVMTKEDQEIIDKIYEKYNLLGKIVISCPDKIPDKILDVEENYNDN